MKIKKSQLAKLISEIVFKSRTIEEKKDDKFLQDIKSTGEWTDYTVAQLKKKKATLMKLSKRNKKEQKEVSQIQFAINAKQGDYK